MQGCRCLTVSSPGFLGAHYEDVQHLFGDDFDTGNRTMQQDLLFQAVDKSREWKARLEAYWGDAKDDDAVASTYTSHLKAWEEHDFSSSEFGDACKENFTKALPVTYIAL